MLKHKTTKRNRYMSETLLRPPTHEDEAEKSLLDSRIDEVFNQDSLDTSTTAEHPLDQAREALDEPAAIGDGQESLFDTPESTFQVPEFYSPRAQRIHERSVRAKGRVEALATSIGNPDQLAIATAETKEQRGERVVARLKAFGRAALNKAKEFGVASVGAGVLVAERTAETVGTFAKQGELAARSKVMELGIKASERLEARAKQKVVDAAHEEAQPYNDYLDDQAQYSKDHAEAIEMDKAFDIKYNSPEQRSIREVRRQNAEYAARRKQERREKRKERLTAVPRGLARLAGRAYRSRTGRTLRAATRAAGNAIRTEWNKEK
jgi:hypothetical protein